MTNKVLIIGATSSVAQAVCHEMAKRGDQLFLVGRNTAHLDAISKDLNTRYSTSIKFIAQDLNDLESFPEMLAEVNRQFGQFNIVLIAHGTLSNQKACEVSVEETLKEYTTNCLSYLALLTIIANQLEQQGHGTIAAISSVAGDRGRQSNYVYGSAKGAVSLFLAGLRNRLAKKNIQVLTIKPGFIDTPMTKEFKKSLLWASPQKVARDIVKAIDKKKDIIYTPWFWRYIMLIIKMLPEKMFKKLSL
jgi:hypothetical protein